MQLEAGNVANWHAFHQVQVDQGGQAIQDIGGLVSGERFGVVNLEGSTNDGQPS